MTVEFISVGTEILLGNIVNTNAAYLSEQCAALGLSCYYQSVVGDNEERLEEAVRRALSRSDILILSGGLGPTKDDLTKQVLCDYFGGTLVEDPSVTENILRIFERRGIKLNALTAAQALVPTSCRVIQNLVGTAPIMWFERADGKVLVAMPGVPFEMEHLMQDEVMPRLKTRFALKQIVHRTLITAGLAESMLAEAIASWEDALPPYLKLAYLPNPGAVRLRLSAYEVDGRQVAQEIEERFEQLRALIPQYIVGYETATVQEQVHRLLMECHATLAVAESCTGGAIASRFTALAGASAYFLCGVVSYSNESKIKVLEVDAVAIKQYGAVSEQVARQMAEGARRISGADYAVATTGIAGPTGGSAEKPVGTVWFAVATPTGTVAVCKQCGTDRGQIIDRASAFAIGLLRDAINEK